MSVGHLPVEGGDVTTQGRWKEILINIKDVRKNHREMYYFILT